MVIAVSRHCLAMCEAMSFPKDAAAPPS